MADCINTTSSFLICRRQIKYLSYSILTPTRVMTLRKNIIYKYNKQHIKLLLIYKIINIFLKFYLKSHILYYCHIGSLDLGFLMNL